MKTQVVHILIRRGLTSEVNEAVYAHEVPILRAARGSGNITVVEEDCKKFCLKPGDVRPRDELLRLKRKYRGFADENGQNPVDLVYPDGSRDIELFYTDPEAFDGAGNVEGGGMIEDDVVYDAEGNPLEGPDTPDPTPATDTGVTSDQGAEAPDRESIISKLEELGVPFAKTTPTVHLQTLLDRSVEAE